ncbi:MAG: hypothetical protein K6A69_06675 [Lachnospiraceae bacterium]|nr:hypothetical protein [Lachnospiraceae bacterium]
MSRLKIDPKKWIAGFLIISLLLIAAVSAMVIILDPYFHYHAPLPGYVYLINNERSQNDGIIKHFDYDGIITGTSMAQNFKASQAEELFGGKFAKITSSGGTYKEVNDMIDLALQVNPGVKTVIRSIDPGFFFFDKDEMREDMGTYPTYLYNKNPFDDLYYILNRDTVFGACIPMIRSKLMGIDGFVTDFDEAGNWMHFGFTFGRQTVMEPFGGFPDPVGERPFTEEERETLKASVEDNILRTALAHPDTDFYYFIPPYSVAWWSLVWTGPYNEPEKYQGGELNREIEAEKLVIETLLQAPNIHLYSWNDNFELTTNLDNYKDTVHYGDWISDEIMDWMKEGKGLLTKDNYMDYLAREKDFYSTFDYNSLLYADY